jgi:hypothetical protein
MYYNALWLTYLIILLFILSFPLFYKCCFSALAATFLLLLSYLLYLSLYNTYLNRLCSFFTLLPKSLFNYFILFLYKHVN